MLPTYKPNDYLVCLKTKNINVNDVIVMETNDLGKVVKRVKSISGNSLKILEWAVSMVGSISMSIT